MVQLIVTGNVISKVEKSVVSTASHKKSILFEFIALKGIPAYRAMMGR